MPGRQRDPLVDQTESDTAATGFNRSAFRTIAVPVERYLFAGRGSFEFAENHAAFFEGTYASTNSTSDHRAVSRSAPKTSTRRRAARCRSNSTWMARWSAIPSCPTRCSIRRPTDEDGDGLRDFYFTKRMADFGTRGSNAERDTFRVVGGLQGSFADDNWHYEAFYAFGQTKEAQTSSGQVNVLNFRNALESIADVEDVDNDGDLTEAICRDANARLQGCVPVDVFGYNSMSPEAVNYIQAPGFAGHIHLAARDRCECDVASSLKCRRDRSPSRWASSIAKSAATASSIR